jgi:GNAT superfamily N-acetyltransferase
MGVRRVAESDLASVVGMVHELAEYERAAHECHLSAEALGAALFGDRPALFGHVAQLPARAGASPELAGVALWFLNFSTWDGVHGIYLEDLYVRPEHRGHGLGRALLAELAAECVRRGYSRLQWSVLDWNEPSLRFYRGLGARPADEWIGYRLTDDALRGLAAEVAVT